MIDDQQLTVYYRSFMGNVATCDRQAYWSIATRTISREAFNQAVREWAQDITSKKEQV